MNKNNVGIIGRATAEQYTDAISKFTDPEDLILYIPKESYSDEFNKMIKLLNIPFKLLGNIGKEEELITIICFTNYININEVILLEEAIKANVTAIFINPK